jgi:hypothetical protein
LLGHLKRKLAVPNACRQTFGESRRGILAIGLHELGKSRKQARLGQAITIDPINLGFGPSFRDISDRCTLMLTVPPRVRCRSCLSSHGLYAFGRAAVRDLSK